MKRINFNTNSKFVYIFTTLSDCISFENIENREYILKNINIVKKNMYSLPNDLRLEVERFIKDVLEPIIYNLDYFRFLRKAEYGELSENGFVIKSDSALEYMIFDLYNHTIELQEKLLKVFAKYIK